jgi:ABC-2 type transport system ATP-binding protein
MTREVALQISHANKSFGPKCALSDVTFDVEPGSVVGLVGPNGAGKTTLLRCIAGMMRLESGSICINGAQPGDALGHILGVAIDQAGCHPGMRAIAHLRWQASAAGLPLTRADEVLDLVDLAAAKRVRFKKMSLGMRQRVNLASALLGSPQLLVLDEPLNGLDPPGIYWMRHVIRQHTERGGSVLLSSHLMSELDEVADRFVVLVDGVVQSDSTRTELNQQRRGIIVVTCADAAAASRALQQQAGTGSSVIDHTTLQINGTNLRETGELLFAAGIAVHELRLERQTLEDLFFHDAIKEIYAKSA